MLITQDMILVSKKIEVVLKCFIFMNLCEIKSMKQRFIITYLLICFKNERFYYNQSLLLYISVMCLAYDVGIVFFEIISKSSSKKYR